MADEKTTAQGGDPKRGKGTFKRKGFEFLGLGLQDYIRYFFGGNASLAIIILILICVFLAREAFMFFPDNHEELEAYRESGQEFVDYIGEGLDAHSQVYSAANIAYFAEVNRTSQEEDDLLRAYRAVLANTENLAKKTYDRLERRLDALEDIEDEIEDLDPADSEDATTLAELNDERSRLVSEIEDYREKLKSEAASAVETDEAWELGVGGKEPSQEMKSKISEAVLVAIEPDAEEEHPFIVDLKETSREKKAVAAEKYAGFKESLNQFRDAAKPIKSLHSDVRDVARENKSEIISFSTAASRKEALLEGAEVAETPEKREEMRQQAEAVVLAEPDFAENNEPLYAAVPKHTELSLPFQQEAKKFFEELPDEFETRSARRNMKTAETYFGRFEDKMETNREKVVEWRHDKPVSIFESFSSFIFGKNWITNSSWHDFFGLLPLLSGSFLIALIALLVAVPFAVAAAIYVNQLAPTREQNFIKPTIEFIEAIPSVVLGFFGILVFGEALRTVSQVEWLSWVPGFPMAERLTILNAGLLLAFMATPTIFTLTEDALNNVPEAMAENSLAMGATRLQTIFRVILPSAVSGVVAAILLGFGRIIGETMVVLLVAGNKIKIPDFTEGIGVIAQPAHTMTGIIAQELGEAAQGSINWRALFMVGMVLFVISLAVNFSAQRVMKRWQKF